MSKNHTIKIFFLLHFFLLNFQLFASNTENTFEKVFTTLSISHLVLHFDINQTIIPFDGVQKKGIEETLSHTCSKSSKISTYKWDPQLPEMTYYDYVYLFLVTGPRSDQSINKKRKNLVCNFINWLPQEHALYIKVTKAYEEALANINSLTDKVIPSFYKLVHKLQKDKIPFTKNTLYNCF